MSEQIITAVSDPAWESEFVAALERRDLGATVSRRCMDIEDLLGWAASGIATAAVVAVDLQRLDREAVARVEACGVSVVCLVPAADEQAEVRARQLGFVHLVTRDLEPAQVLDSVRTALAARRQADRVPSSSRAWSRSVGALEPSGATEPEQDVPQRSGPGRIVAVWGPTGAPGRSMLAATLASELAVSGLSALLVDADAYGGTQAQSLGILEEAPGLAAAVRAATRGSLDVPTLAALARDLGNGLRVLTGISRPERWPELRPSGIEVVLEQCRWLADVVVVDTGFCLEADEELSYDTMAPRRNGATLAVLDLADDVLAVGAADPVGCHRLVRAVSALREAAPDVEPRLVVNKVRRGLVAGDLESELRSVLLRHAGREPIAFLPFDVLTLDAALSAGRTVPEVAPKSPLRRAVHDLAATLVGLPESPGRGSRTGRRAAHGRVRPHRSRAGSPA